MTRMGHSSHLYDMKLLRKSKNDQRLRRCWNKGCAIFVCNHGLIEVTCKEILSKHCDCLAGKRRGGVQFCNQRNPGVLMQNGEETGIFFAKTQYAGVLCKSGTGIIIHVLLTNIKKNVEKNPADSCIGHLACLQQFTELIP